MTLHRAYFPSSALKHARVGDAIELSHDVEHRLLRVLRLKPSDQVELFDQDGMVALGHISSTNSAYFEIDELKGVVKSPIRLTLMQALVKSDKLEEIVQRNTEIGVDRFVVFVAERSVVKVTDRTATQIERLTRIAADAARQCERNDIPRIEGPFLVSQLNSHWNKQSTLVLLGDPRGGLPLLETLKNADMTKLSEIVLVVGPEGGLSETEEKAFFALGAIPVCYARHVLRTETAGIVGTSVIQGFL